MSQPIRIRTTILVFRLVQNRHFVQDIEFLLPDRFFSNSDRCSQKKIKYLSNSEAETAILVFLISPKNTNLVGDVEFLLPVKFCQIHSANSEEKLKILQPKRG